MQAHRWAAPRGGSREITAHVADPSGVETVTWGVFGPGGQICTEQPEPSHEPSSDNTDTVWVELAPSLPMPPRHLRGQADGNEQVQRWTYAGTDNASEYKPAMLAVNHPNTTPRRVREWGSSTNSASRRPRDKCPSSPDHSGRLGATPTHRLEQVPSVALSAPVIASSGDSRAMAVPGHGLSAAFRMTDGSSPVFRWLDVPGHPYVLRADLWVELVLHSRHFLSGPERDVRTHYVFVPPHYRGGCPGLASVSASGSLSAVWAPSLVVSSP
jgi:hypothetical protein